MSQTAIVTRVALETPEQLVARVQELWGDPQFRRGVLSVPFRPDGLTELAIAQIARENHVTAKFRNLGEGYSALEAAKK